MDQNLSSYRIFHTVAKTGNISRAASELYISQPAISKAISKLESSMEVTLFHRNSRGVTLTEEGKILYEHTTTAFDSLEQARQHISKIHSLGIGQIKIGVSTTLCKYILLPYLKAFIEENPHIKITIECHSTFQTLQQLEEGKIDLGLIGSPEDLKDIVFYELQEITDCFVTSPTYLENLMLREEDVHLDNILSKGNVMLLDEKNITRVFIEEYFRKHSIQLNQILEISNMDLLIEFSKIGLGVGCVIRQFVKEELKNGTLLEVPLTPPLDTRKVGFAYSSKYPLNNSLLKFIDFLQNHSTI